MSGAGEALRGIPAVERVLGTPPLPERLASWERGLVVAAVREVLQEARERLLRDPALEPPEAAEVAREAVCRLDRRWAGDLRRVVNATGIPLHTNLGRAPLALEARQALSQVAAGYCSLEIDLETGRRRSRLARVARMLSDLAGSEAATAVNNNAAAVYTCLHVLAAGRPVVVSRGEQVEIGGSFRLPDIIEASGARLLEVGTTNRTRAADFRRALEKGPALILKVHPSNYTIQGFTEETSTEELAEIARRAGILLMVDAGSGALDQQPISLRGDEATVQDYLRAGADLVTASGDKLLGGPQAGLVFGRADPVERIRAHPLARVVRLDKLLLCALEATLSTLARGAAGWSRIPLAVLAARGVEELEREGRRLREALLEALGGDWEVDLVSTEVAIGGGSLPGRVLPSRALALRHPNWPADRLSSALRAGQTPIVGRIVNDQLHLDLRTLLDEDMAELARIAAAAIRRAGMSEGGRDAEER